MNSQWIYHLRSCITCSDHGGLRFSTMTIYWSYTNIFLGQYGLSTLTDTKANLTVAETWKFVIDCHILSFLSTNISKLWLYVLIKACMNNFNPKGCGGGVHKCPVVWRLSVISLRGMLCSQKFLTLSINIPTRM